MPPPEEIIQDPPNSSQEPPVSQDVPSLSDDRSIFNLPTKVAQPERPAAADDDGGKTPAEPEKTPAKEPVPSTLQPAKTADTKQEDNEPPAPFFPPKAEEKKPDAPAAKSADAEAIRNEPVPKDFKGKTADLFNNAKSKWAGIVEAKDAQLQKVEKAHGDALVALQQKNEQLEKRVADLSGYESVIDFQSSEKFKNEYEAPVKSAEQELVDFMKDSGATEEGLKELKDNIGDNAYLNGAMQVLFKNNPGIASQFSLMVSKLREARRKQNDAISNARQNHGKLIDERRTEGAKKQAETEKAVREAIAFHTSAMSEDKQTPQFPFLMKIKAPDNATPEQSQQIEAHNKMVDDNIRDLERVVKSNDPKEMVRMAVGYMTAVVQAQYIQRLRDEIIKRDEWIAKVRKASAPPEKAGGATMPSTAKTFDGSLSDLATDQFIRR